jgi:hypothetical protein
LYESTSCIYIQSGRPGPSGTVNIMGVDRKLKAGMLHTEHTCVPKAGIPTSFLGKWVCATLCTRAFRKINYLVSTKPPKIISAARPCYLLVGGKYMSTMLPLFTHIMSTTGSKNHVISSYIIAVSATLCVAMMCTISYYPCPPSCCW